MQKTKRSKFVLVIVVMLSLLTMYGGYTPNANAASLDSAKDTISDSSPSTTGVTHTIVFNTGVDLSNGTVITVSFNSNFGTSLMSATCPSDATAATSTGTITCTVNSALSSTTDYTITGTNITNPATSGSYDVTISHNESGANESTQMLVYIIDSVTVTASVDASLTFSIEGTATSTTINSETTTGSTTATLLNFGTLGTTQKILGQKLVVATNAANGFSVTVQQNHNLQTAASADIDSYSTSSPSAWTSPTPDINDENTWGYMALTTDDTDVGFGSSNYQGLDGTNPLTVMTHTGPTDGENTPTEGRTYVAYSIEVSSMQEAGDYENTLTYICTPTF